MIYKFILDYTPTISDRLSSRRICNPLYGDDLSVNIEIEDDEWYRKRKLEGKLTFVRADYDYIMGCAFDGTFKLTIQSSTDDGASWQNYFEGTFSRANLEIDEDNKNAVLDGLNEVGEYDVIENGKDEEFDLMKVIPDGDAREVQGRVRPALAMVDYNSPNINQSDLYCIVPFIGAGYKEDSGFKEENVVASDTGALFMGIYAECQVVMKDNNSPLNGRFKGKLDYDTKDPDPVHAPSLHFTSVQGDMYNDSDYRVYLTFGFVAHNLGFLLSRSAFIFDQDNHSEAWSVVDRGLNYYSSPSSFVFDESDNANNPIKTITVYFHYIRATLLTQSGGNADNVLDTGDYYKRMAAFNNGDGGLNIEITTNTVEQPNGYRLVPGTGEQGTIPQYFAPPDENHDWIPLEEYGWQYASMWYTIQPSVANGLLDESKTGTFRWTRCWTLGTCIDRLLKKITNNKVSFEQSEAGSQFLYAAVNPLTQGEPFEYLFTQKSNVMSPSDGGESASRCIVRLEWFFEFLRNALNCYWWLEERSGGTYVFRVEHVEWFRRGGSYTGQMNAQFNLTEIKTRRNFLRNGEAAKRLDDQLHKYSYDMDGMTEKYLFSWQGDGGSDAFKGNPMLFKAGWVEKGTSESHEVDNIFADLAWLMLNAGSDTASSQNYEGIFAFAGYRAERTLNWKENKAPVMRYPPLASGSHVAALYNIWLTAPEGQVITFTLRNTYTMEEREEARFIGTGSPQVIRLTVDELSIGGNMVLYADFGANYTQVVIHRVHAMTGYVYNVPNVADRLNPVNYLQNGPLAWPWLQCEYLHYYIPARMWGYKSDDLDELNERGWWEPTGTVKLRKKQEIPLLPLPTKNDEVKLQKGVIGGLRDSQRQLQTGIVKSATINLGTRNAEVTVVYDMIS